jgi:proline iminopeptidase
VAGHWLIWCRWAMAAVCGHRSLARVSRWCCAMAGQACGTTWRHWLSSLARERGYTVTTSGAAAGPGTRAHGRWTSSLPILMPCGHISVVGAAPQAGISFGADLALRYALRYPHRVTAVVYICGSGLAWNAHRHAHNAAARARHSQHELDRLASLATAARTPAQEREFLTLTWAADYADHARGLAAADEMAGAGMPVNYQLNQTISRELQAESPAALAAACQALTVPVLLLHGGQDPRPATACDTLAHALPARPASSCPKPGTSPGPNDPNRPEPSCGTSSPTAKTPRDLPQQRAPPTSRRAGSPGHLAPPQRRDSICCYLTRSVLVR